MALFEGDVSAEEPLEEQALERQLAEAEARWKEVGYYRTISAGDLFDAPDDPIAQRVNKRLRDFSRKEIAAIVTGAEVTSGPGLDQEQTRRLRELAKLPDAHLALLRQLLDALDERRIAALRVVLDGILRDPASVHAVVGPALKRPAVPAAPTPAMPDVKRPAGPTRRPMVTPAAPPPSKAPVVKRAVKPPYPVGEAFSRATEQLADEAVSVNEKASHARLKNLSQLSSEQLEAVHEAESNT